MFGMSKNGICKFAFMLGFSPFLSVISDVPVICAVRYFKFIFFNDTKVGVAINSISALVGANCLVVINGDKDFCKFGADMNKVEDKAPFLYTLDNLPANLISMSFKFNIPVNGIFEESAIKSFREFVLKSPVNFAPLYIVSIPKNIGEE